MDNINPMVVIAMEDQRIGGMGPEAREVMGTRG